MIIQKIHNNEVFLNFWIMTKIQKKKTQLDCVQLQLTKKKVEFLNDINFSSINLPNF